jgi:hypothetical protein
MNNFTDTASSALHLDIDSENRLRTKLDDKRNDFNFPIMIVNFPFIWSNIPAAPAYVPIMISLIEGCY